jgi:hypothetical protein
MIKRAFISGADGDVCFRSKANLALGTGDDGSHLDNGRFARRMLWNGDVCFISKNGLVLPL